MAPTPWWSRVWICCFFFQAEDGIRDRNVTGVQTCASSDLQVHHGSEILDATVHLRPHADFTFQLVFLTRGVLCGAAIRPKIGFAHAVFEGLDLRLQRSKIGRASCRERVEEGGGGGWVVERC